MYKKREFKSGDILTAAALNEMDEQIQKNEQTVESLSSAITDLRGTASLPDETVQFVSSVAEMTDLEKRYVLDGYIYEGKTVVVEGVTTSPDLFEPTET